MGNHASTSTVKSNIHIKNHMLFIWWNQLGVVYCSNGANTTSDTTEFFSCMLILVHMLQRRSTYLKVLISLLLPIPGLNSSGKFLYPFPYYGPDEQTTN